MICLVIALPFCLEYVAWSELEDELKHDYIYCPVTYVRVLGCAYTYICAYIRICICFTRIYKPKTYLLHYVHKTTKWVALLHHNFSYTWKLNCVLTPVNI